MSLNGKDADADAAAEQHIENNNNSNNTTNNNNDLKDTSFTPAALAAAAASSSSNPDTFNATSSSSFTQHNPTNSNSNSLSRRSLSDVYTLDIQEPQQQLTHRQHPSTPTPSTNSKLNSTPYDYTSTNGVPQGHYRNTLPSQDDNFKLFTIYGNGEFSNNIFFLSLSFCSLY